jgi:hypothetical protein
MVILKGVQNSSFNQGILYRGGRGWYGMCSCQPTVGFVVSEIKQNIYSHFLGDLQLHKR